MLTQKNKTQTKKRLLRSYKKNSKQPSQHLDRNPDSIKSNGRSCAKISTKINVSATKTEPKNKGMKKSLAKTKATPTENLLYYALVTRRLTHWNHIIKRFFRGTTQENIDSLKEHWKSITSDRKAFEKVKKSTGDLLARNNNRLDDYILSADGCRLDYCPGRYTRYNLLSSILIYYARITKQISSWTQIAGQFFPKSTHTNLTLGICNRWTTINRNQKLFEKVKKSTEEMIENNCGSLDNYILSADGNDLEVREFPYIPAKSMCQRRPFSMLENSMLYYACTFKNMESWMEIFRQFFPKSNRMYGSLRKRWLNMNQNKTQLGAIKKSTENLIKKYGGSLDRFVLSPDGSKLLVCKKTAPKNCPR
ncbi:hypothetical protein Ciccas_003980 [Cichlidogyrus casuarinus]|uniref:Uncharacterized protein n=1 Tax=Cichlidogyrus casuarinus TaxID=1844966 RepID=A0ABD2QCW1_9PLAT